MLAIIAASGLGLLGLWLVTMHLWDSYSRKAYARGIKDAQNADRTFVQRLRDIPESSRMPWDSVWCWVFAPTRAMIEREEELRRVSRTLNVGHSASLSSRLFDLRDSASRSARIIEEGSVSGVLTPPVLWPSPRLPELIEVDYTKATPKVLSFEDLSLGGTDA